MDVVIALPGSTGVYLLNNGADGFAAAQPLAGSDWNVMYTAHDMTYDMDNDGDKDLLFYTTDNQYSPLQGVAWVENFAADPYLLSGTAFADLNGDGQHDPDEPALPSVTITTDPGGYIVQNGTTGDYVIHCPAGTQVVSAAPPNVYWQLTTTDASYTVEPSADQPTFEGLDFGFQPLVSVVSITPELVLSSAACGDTTSLWISLLNDGTVIGEGTVALTLDPGFTFVSSDPAPVSVTGQTIAWPMTGLSYGAMEVIHATVIMPVPDNLGMPYSNSVVVSTVDADGLATGTFNATNAGLLTCSYDPNDKQVSPLGYGVHGAVALDTDHLDYTIRFQNTGTAPAIDVMLRDDLPSSLDLSRLDILGASHTPTEVSVSPSGELVVRFTGYSSPIAG
jgi:uncharacterized repeat protein (TIGR01451 family)